MAKKKRLTLPSGFTRNTFREHAKEYQVVLGGTKVGVASPRENSTGSLGHRMDTKLQMQIGGFYVWVQVTFMATVIGSKDLPPEGVVSTPNPAPAGEGKVA